jgi:hypothetical protein
MVPKIKFCMIHKLIFIKLAKKTTLTRDSSRGCEVHNSSILLRPHAHMQMKGRGTSTTTHLKDSITFE